ncbi:uncharacterized protein LOC110942726 [Helianthus annuus]|uniref:uncharacterized protein LOC110942726 n=1 Tax=Helianthus annuus TaxID=4232 RepID=UPI000B906BE6|nr:uncharacterized protein LOC110942726 [Helianthus annuus]
MKGILEKTISGTQSAFLKGRFILDGPLLINETIGWLKNMGKRAFLLKLDFEKAYDNVNWGFLLSSLDNMGFPGRWCSWVKGILESAHSAVLVNGSPTFEFQCEKGFDRVTHKAVGLGEFKGVDIGSGDKTISHLFYADDALIVGEWSKSNVDQVARILRVFHMCSGGLGISRMVDVNLALLAKWAWRFSLEVNSKWRGIIEAIHGGRGLWSFLPVKRSIPGCWKSIVNVLDKVRLPDKSLHQMIKGTVGVGNGTVVRYWFDIWIGDVTLKNRWPCLYSLDRNKGCRVMDRFKPNGVGLLFAGNWRRQPTSVEELSEMQDLVRLLHGFKLADREDRWVWNDGAKGPFSVADCKRILKTNVSAVNGKLGSR